MYLRTRRKGLESVIRRKYDEDMDTTVYVGMYTGVELVGDRQGKKKQQKKESHVFLCFPYMFSRLVSSDRFVGRQVPKTNSSTPGIGNLRNRKNILASCRFA